MIFSIQALISLFIAEFVIDLKPGPTMMAFSGMALAGHWKSVFLFWLGNLIGGTILYAGLLGGLSLIPPSFGIVFIFIKSAAAMLLVSMGFSSLQNAIDHHHHSAAHKTEQITGKDATKSILSGFLIALSNPFDIVFILTVIPALTETMTFSLIDIIVIRTISVISFTIVLYIYCLPLLILRKAFNDRALIALKYISSGIMIAIGLFMAYNMMVQFDLYESGLLG